MSMDNTNNQPNPSLSIIELTSIINRTVSEINRLKEQIKANKQMVDDSYENDKNYHEQAEKVKDITKNLKTIKQQITKQPAVTQSSEKVKGLREDIKDQQDALSRYLAEYQKLTDATIIEDENGEIREIIHTYKLVKKKRD